jgi:hypothetical protein
MAQSSSSTSAPRGSQGTPTPNNYKGTANIYMMKFKTNLSTRDHKYGMPESVEKGKQASNPLIPLQIENKVGETITHIHKGAFKKASHDQNKRDSQNYSIMEDLAQTPCAMSSLEFLQSFPSQRKVLLFSLGAVETSNSGMIIFYPTYHKPCVPHHVSF